MVPHRSWGVALREAGMITAFTLWSAAARAQELPDAPPPDGGGAPSAVGGLEDLLVVLLDELRGWAEAAIRILPSAVLALLVLGVFVLLARTAARLTEQALNRVSDNKEVASLLRVGVRSAVMIVGAFLALRIVGLNGVVASLMAGVGVVGLALGFAFQDIAANFVSGVLLALNRPYKIGDLIRTDGFFGVVEELDLRNTYIRALTGERIIVPNKDVYGDALINYSEAPRRRIDISCGVSYRDDLKKARDVVTAALSALSGRDAERPVQVFFGEFGDSSINFTARIWVKTENQAAYLALQSEAIIAIKASLDDAGIAIPFPIRTLDFGARAVGGVRLDDVLPPQAS